VTKVSNKKAAVKPAKAKQVAASRNSAGEDEPTYSVKGNRKWSRKLLVILLTVFAVVMAVNIVMVWFAVESNTGIVSENAYEEGLAYNKTLAEQAREAGLGWSVVRNVADFPVRLVYALSDERGMPLGGAWVRVKASRPVGQDEGSGFELELKEFTDGTYAAENIAWPQKGQWELETTFVYEGKSLTAHERVNVQ
jgi:nitrogen fixation protein FixH